MNRRSFFASIIGASLAAKLSTITRKVTWPTTWRLATVSAPVLSTTSAGTIWVRSTDVLGGTYWYVRHGDRWVPMVEVNDGEENSNG